MDIFSLFQRGHEVYARLQEHDPAVDVSLPGLLDNTILDMSVQVPKDKVPIGKEQTPYQLFCQQPQEIKGTLATFDERLQSYIATVAALPVTIYRQFASALSAWKNTNLIHQALAAFENIINDYPGTTAEPNSYEVTLKMRLPAKLVLYSANNNVGMVYHFQTGTVTISGFSDTSLVHHTAALGDLPVDITSVEVVPDVLIETVGVILNFPSCTRMAITERVEIYQQTVDDMLDHIIQKLVIADVLDAVQDIILGENGDIYLCFDPVLDRDEIDAIVLLLKEAYPQALLVDTPSENESPWWVIQIAKIADTAVQVSNAGVGQPEEKNAEGIIAKKADDTISMIADEVDVDAAIASVSK